MHRYALLLLLPLAGTLRAEQLDIDLRSGEHVFGALISQDHDQVVVERSFWRHRTSVITANYAIPRNTIMRMQTVVDLEADYRAHLAACGATYAARYDLARWCLDRRLVAHAFENARLLLADDPQDAVTLQLIDDIGYIRENGVWVTREAFAVHHQLVEYGGTLMTAAEAGARAGYSAACRQIQDGQQHIDDLGSEILADTLTLRDATVADKRAERHQQEARRAAEEAHLKSLTPDQLADEQEAHRFNLAYHIAEPAPTDTDEVIKARKDFDAAERRYEQAVADLAATRANVLTLEATRDGDAATIARLSGLPFPPVVTTALPAAHAP
jgi:hypothetical protein